MSKNGTNCCSANNVDRTNEVYVLKDTGRFAYHNWQNDLIGEQAPDSVAVNRPERAARSQGAEGRKTKEGGARDKSNTKTNEKISEDKAAQKAAQEEKKADQKRKKDEAA